MSTTIKVLLVDDKEDYCKSLSGVARHKNLRIVYQLDWETGFEILKNDPSIEFVILDGKGKIEADQETEKDNFVIRAMRDIDDWSKENGLDIPYCVNTGFMERFEALEGNVKIFEKTDKDRDLMFGYIVDEVSQSEYRTLRMQFDESFSAFDKGILNIKNQHLLIDIIKAYNAQDYRKKNINVQRDLLEAIYISLNNPIPCIPRQLFNHDGRPNHESCTRFMEDRDSHGHKLNKLVPQDIKSSFRKLKESTNRYSHLADNIELKAPFLANTFLLMEVLNWIPEFVEEHYKNHM